MKFRDVTETTKLGQKNNCQKVIRQAEGIPGHFNFHCLRRSFGFFSRAPKCAHIIYFACVLSTRVVNQPLGRPRDQHINGIKSSKKLRHLSCIFMLNVWLSTHLWTRSSNGVNLCTRIRENTKTDNT